MHLGPNTQASYFPCEALYSLIPDVPPEEPPSEAGPGHAATRRFCQEVSQGAGIHISLLRDTS